MSVLGRYATGMFKIYLFAIAWLSFLVMFHNDLMPPEAFRASVFIGIIGIWRYSWLVLNFLRAIWFRRVTYKAMRSRADQIWQQGWRPGQVHILMTTYHEVPDTTYKYLKSIVTELRRHQLNGTLWVGYGADFDKEIITEWFESQEHAGVDLVLIRQTQPGKRMAISALLRALSRHGVSSNDIAFLMDGDSILATDTLYKSVSLFGADPELKALTTDEDSVVSGPHWVRLWLTMRFAQRRMWMQSHALSGRVLTLTGRMSAFRAPLLTDHAFIRNIEADYLNHWLWGSFRFLSGDDKSSWYVLLKQGAKMTYVPDAMVYTIEYIEGNGIKRMYENLFRWSGNMLRNGTRAILLGPRKVTPYIWWCLIDQRLSIWTIFIGFCTAMMIMLFVTPAFFITYVLWISLTRFLLSCILWRYAHGVYLSFPLLLYINQLVTAFIKIYLQFRLPKQRWANRKNQKGGQDVLANPWKRLWAIYLTSFSVLLALTIAMFLSGVLQMPYHFQIP